MKKILLVLGGILLMNACIFASTSDHIKGITSISEVFGDGQKVSAVAVEYDNAIDMSKLNINSFKVTDNTITKIYTNTKPEKTQKANNGKYVILELSTAIAPEAALGPEEVIAAIAAKTGQSMEEVMKHFKEAEAQGPKLGSKPDFPHNIKNMVVEVAQIGEVVTVGGTKYLGDNKTIKSNQVVNLVVEDFKQFTFNDTKNKQTLMYNLYIPKNYDSSKKYPLVLFMHDAGAVDDNPIYTLIQGNGATAWATTEAQAKNECFVLAPQYQTVITDDNNQITNLMDVTINLVKDLETKYSIDTKRIYNTGQSMGGMTSIVMNSKYSDIFAASLLVACQWDPSIVKPMANKPIWIVVSEGDKKALPGMNAITEVLKKNGATVSKALWNAEADKAELDTNVKYMIENGTNIKFTVFKGGSHGYTWQHAYSIDGIREWLFKQAKK